LKKHEQNRFREQVATMVFDELRLSGLYFIKSSVANSFAHGRTSAIIVDSGHTFTCMSRVLDGYEEQSTVLNFGGNSVDEQIEQLLLYKNLLGKTNYHSLR
jgi:actin-related protein